MASQLENELFSVKHCWGVYEQISIVNSVRVDDWTAEWAFIASNATFEHKGVIKKVILRMLSLPFMW